MDGNLHQVALQWRIHISAALILQRGPKNRPRSTGWANKCVLFDGTLLLGYPIGPISKDGMSQKGRCPVDCWFIVSARGRGVHV
jgi:hypothetical protein